MIKKMINEFKKSSTRHLSLKTMVGATLVSTQVLLSLGSLGASEPLNKDVDIDIVEMGSINDMGVGATTQTNPVNDIDYAQLDFQAMKYGGTYYLTLEKKDMLMLIKKALNEVDKEYVENGNKTVFAECDSKYSYFDEYHILGMMTTETDLRMIELKDADKLFDVNNYKRYCDVNYGVVYNGLGMMNSTTLKYLKETDRQQVNKFEDYEYLPVANTKVKLEFENLNPYDYVLASQPQTEYQYKKCLAENIMFSAKCSYIYLNRIVKDNIKKGTHDKGYNTLMSYSQLSQYSNKEKQIYFGLLGYNQGPNDTYISMVNGGLFDKDIQGDYVNNLNYPLETFDHANQLRAEFEQELAQ